MSGPEKIESRSGRGVVVRGDDIDTDRIIPARFMVAVSFAGLEDHVFSDARYAADGTPKDHAFNNASFAGASILVVNQNFGCGSSREHAPQALMRWGIRAIVGESFAEIFSANCTAMGIPAVTAAASDVASLMDSVELDPAQEVTVDVVAGTITSRVGTAPVQLPAGARSQLLDGTWHVVGTLLEARAQIAATAAQLPYTTDFAD